MMEYWKNGMLENEETVDSIQKTEDSGENAVEVGGALRLRVEAEDRRKKIE